MPACGPPFSPLHTTSFSRLGVSTLTGVPEVDNEATVAEKRTALRVGPTGRPVRPLDVLVQKGHLRGRVHGELRF